MDTDAIVGWIVVAGALGLLAYLVFWSRRRIDRISRKGFASARQIEKELRGDG